MHWSTLVSVVPIDTCESFGLLLTTAATTDHLDLHTNKFSGIIPTGLGLLSSLIYLDLSYNSLRGTVPTQLGALVNLSKCGSH